jgi:threonine dehydratase
MDTDLDLAARSLGVLIEPSAAAGLAAIACHDLPGVILATVLTGKNATVPALDIRGRRGQS